MWKIVLCYILKSNPFCTELLLQLSQKRVGGQETKDTKQHKKRNEQKTHKKTPHVQVYFWSLYFVLFVTTTLFDYCNFIVRFKLGIVVSPSLVLFYKIVLAILFYLLFQITFSISLSLSTKYSM